MSMPIVARVCYCPRLALAALVVLAACAAIEQPAAPPPRVAATPRDKPAMATVPTFVPASPPVTPRAPTVEESEAGDVTGFKDTTKVLPTPALAALDPARNSAPEVVAAARPPGSAAPVPDTAADSLLPRIGPKTPPNVAAAMRLIEEGRQQLVQGRYDQALDRFERGVAIDPTNAYGYYYLAQLHYLMKKYDQAIAVAGRAVTLAAHTTDRAWLARAYGLQGAVFEEVGRYADARKAYQKAVETDPNNVAARVGMGRVGGAH